LKAGEMITLNETDGWHGRIQRDPAILAIADAVLGKSLGYL
jgi:hypothetical protein